MIKLIDLFCGAGGVTTGFERARYNGVKFSDTIACVNHDAKAISSHFQNHKHVRHFTEDIRTLDLTELLLIVQRTRRENPGCKIVLWASLECTNFSKAKGGLSRKGDSRMLGDEMYRYIETLDPDYFMVENVEEFVDWGPVRIKSIAHKNYSELVVDKKGEYVFVPVKELIGTFFKRWKNKIQGYGYKFDDNNEGTLNAANYGACQSRKRYFAAFAKDGLPIVWPKPTHCKNPIKEKNNLKRWEPVRNALDLEDHGSSIFVPGRLKSEKSRERIYEGLIKHVAGGKKQFILKYNSVNGKTGKHVPPSVDEPSHTIPTQGRMGLVTAQYIHQYHAGNRNKNRCMSIEEASRTVPTENRYALVSAQFINKNYSGRPQDKNAQIDLPLGTVTTVDHHALVSPQFLNKYFSGSPENKNASIDDPSATVLTKDRFALLSPEFLVNYHGKRKDDKSLNDAAGTVTTKDDCGLVTPQFLKIDYSGGGNSKNINTPGNTVTSVGKTNLISCIPFIVDTNFSNDSKSVDDPSRVILTNRHHHYLVNPQWGINSGRSTDDPCFTIIASMDKTPPYLVTTEDGFLAIEIYETDTYYTRLIKEFMALYGIADIKMRMLKVTELLLIQGFPKGYILMGNQSDQKKFIGNAVEVNMAEAIATALFGGLVEENILKVAA